MLLFVPVVQGCRKPTVDVVVVVVVAVVVVAVVVVAVVAVVIVVVVVVNGCCCCCCCNQEGITAVSFNGCRCWLSIISFLIVCSTIACLYPWCPMQYRYGKQQQQQ